MPSKEKCSKGWKKMGYKSKKDCTSYGKKKTTLESQQEKLMEKQTGKDLQKKYSA